MTISQSKNLAAIGLLCLLLIASSCKTKKIVTGGSTSHRIDSSLMNNEAVKMIQKSRDNDIAYDWLTTRVRVEYNDENLSQDFTAVVRMRRDSVLWISLQGPFGIEGGRILVTRDSIFIINKLSGEYLRQPISYLSKVMPMQTDLSHLQDFIMGNYLLFAGGTTDYRGMEDSLQQIQTDAPVFRYRTRLYPQNYTLAQSVLTDKMMGREMSITFGGYSQEMGKPFAGERNIDIKGPKHISLHLAFTKIKVNEILSFPFEIDPGLRQVDQIRF